MTPHVRATHRSFRPLGGLLVLGLIPVAGLGISLSAATGSKFPRTMVNACLAMMGAAWSATQHQLSVDPVTGMAALLIGGSFFWALVRTGASLVYTRRLFHWSKGYAPGRYPKLDAILSRPDLGGVELRLFDTLGPMALTAGLWHPRVIVSEAMISSLSEEELRSVLFHELAHVERRDPLRLAVARFLADALWFLPVARSVARDFVDAVEEGADDCAVAATRQPAELAAALVKTARAGIASPMPLANSLAGNLSVEDRVERLLGMRMGRRSAATIGRWLVSGLITLLLLVLVMLPSDGREAAAQRAIAEAMRGMPTMTCSVSPR